MNIEEWIAEHTGCIVSLSRIIDGIGNEPLKSVTLVPEDSCALGKWICGEGRSYRMLPRYRDMVRKHARFHAIAANVLRKAEGNDRAGARTAFNGTLAGASAALLRAIVDLKPEVIGGCRPKPGRYRVSAQQKRAIH